MTWKRQIDGSHYNSEDGWFIKRERVFGRGRGLGKTYQMMWALYETPTRAGLGEWPLVAHYRTLGEAKKAAGASPGLGGQRSVVGGALAAVAASVPAGFGFAFGSTWGEQVAGRVFGGRRAARRPAIGYGVFDFFGAWHVTVWSPDLAPGSPAYLDRRGAIHYGDFDVADRKFQTRGAAEAAGKAWVAQRRKHLKGTPAGRGYGRGGVKVVGQLKKWKLLRDEAGRFHLADPETGRLMGVEAGTGRVDSPGEVPTHVKIWLIRGMTGKVPRKGEEDRRR